MVEIERHYTVPETADILRLERQAVLRRIHSGQLRAVAVSPRKFVVPESAIQEFLDASRVGGAQ